MLALLGMGCGLTGVGLIAFSKLLLHKSDRFLKTVGTQVRSLSQNS
ncbi:MAG: hypothetical protein F6K50_42095 [Moorea sp. SIO3I7]|nr:MULTISPECIES: hypothetical protein [unclassified Moorena]NEO01749.1 hypothetical protein [Moorena sp. SIO3I7]